MRVQVSELTRLNKHLQDDAVDLSKLVQTLLVARSGSGGDLPAS